MPRTSRMPKNAALLPNGTITSQPMPNNVVPAIQTKRRLTWPDTIGRSERYRRSNPTSKASLRNIPPLYSRVAPRQSSPKRPPAPPPARNHGRQEMGQARGQFQTPARPRQNGLFRG